VADSLAFFTSNEWIYSASNLLSIYSALTSEVDKELFDVELNQRKFSWEKYIILGCRGNLFLFNLNYSEFSSFHSFIYIRNKTVFAKR
jgi:hypothetical protein